jgi:putative membrane protein
MQAFVWILRFLIVLVLVWFAVKNAQPVVLNGFPGQTLEAPLVFVLLVVFIGGVVIGLLAWIPTVVRQRREIGKLRRNVAQLMPAAMPPVPAEVPAAEPPRDVHGV